MTQNGNAPTFSLITFCKGRLDHLKQSLPRMLSQPDAEVVLVDFSCPQGASTFVQENYPQVKIVEVPDRTTFAICEARNVGAAAATGKWLVFVDADTVLRKGALGSLANKLRPNSFGRFANGRDLRIHKSSSSPLSLNSLRGFMMLERRAFEALGGYDQVLLGYGAGGDVEFDYRLRFFKFAPMILPETLIDHVIQHDDAMRLKHAGLSLSDSYLRGRVYFQMKRTFLGFFGQLPPSEVQAKMYAKATELSETVQGGSKLGSTNFDFHEVKVKIDKDIPAMTFKLSLNIDVELEDS